MAKVPDGMASPTPLPSTPVASTPAEAKPPATAPAAKPTTATTTLAETPHANDSFERPKPTGPSSRRIIYRATGELGEPQLSILTPEAQKPSQGEWIGENEIKPTLALIDSIVAGKTNVTIEETTEPWFSGRILGWFFRLFTRECPGFKQNIKNDLTKLCRTPMGRQLLNELSESKFPVVFRPTTSKKGGLVRPDNDGDARRSSDQSGSGSGATVLIPYDLTDETFVVYKRPCIMEPWKKPEMIIPTEDDEIPQPRFMTVGHELIHVHRGQRGLIEPRGSHRKDGYLNEEEFQTINGSYTITENKLRRAFNMPTRFGHYHHRQ